jgi:hypothetical protein
MKESGGRKRRSGGDHDEQDIEAILSHKDGRKFGKSKKFKKR